MNVGKFVLNIVVAFIAYGILYTVGGMIFEAQFAAGMAHMKPEEEVMVPTLAYHFVQTVVVVWLFGKAVGSGCVKSGAMFGFMVGLYLLATDATWYVMLKDFPQDGRMALGLMHLVIGALIGAMLAVMWGKGMGFGAVANDD